VSVLSPRTRTLALIISISERDRACALMRGLHVDQDDQAAIDRAWSAVRALIDDHKLDFRPIAALVLSARQRGVSVDARQIARACACACQRDLRSQYPLVARALVEPVARVVPAAGATLVPAPVIAWPAGGGVS
jgi:hypothetical protein